MEFLLGASVALFCVLIGAAIGRMPTKKDRESNDY